MGRLDRESQRGRQGPWDLLQGQLVRCQYSYHIAWNLTQHGGSHWWVGGWMNEWMNTQSSVKLPLMGGTQRWCILVNWGRAQWVGKEVLTARHSPLSNEGAARWTPCGSPNQGGHLLPLQVTKSLFWQRMFWTVRKKWTIDISEVASPGDTLHTQKSSCRRDLLIQMVKWDHAVAELPSGSSLKISL